mgnify:CR=1 FL=1|tara:strand:+ start:153 stop:476 length:324 start_codon:yes stop_codon:yes gene_type:complete
MAYKQSPFPMVKGTEGHSKYKERQLKKAARLTKKAEKQEKKAAEAKAFTKEQYDMEEGSLFAFQPSGKRSRKRAGKAEFKAAMGSRKAWKRAKKNFSSVRPLYFDMD